MLADRRLRDDNLYAQVRGAERGAAPGTAGVGTRGSAGTPDSPGDCRGLWARQGLSLGNPQSDGIDTTVLV